MYKIYKAYTGVSLFVKKKGETRHTLVSFREQGAGGSLYDTHDADLQEAIESHREFGKTIFVKMAVPSPEEVEDATSTGAVESQHINEYNAAAQQPHTESEEKVHDVADIEEAKRILVEVYDIAPTKCNTPSKMKKVASELGVKFNYTEEE